MVFFQASCGSVTQMRRVLMNCPEIVSIGLVWNSEKPSLDHIMEVFSCVNTTLQLKDVFSTVTDSRWAETTTHNLVGMVTYYGKHYSTFFFHTKLMEWIFLDDATVRDVGPRWEQVVEKCRRGKFQPLLLLYATPDGTPVNAEYAPKSNTPFYTDKNKPPLPMGNQQLLRRSITPSPEKPIVGNTRRAITPNPESSTVSQKPQFPKSYNEYQNLSVIQKNINISKDLTGFDQVDECAQKSLEYISRKSADSENPTVNIHRTLSNGSSSGVESGVCIPDHLNIPRRRDSGNWSRDRNSASSASSTTMENPYLYLVGKVPPGSPNRTKGDGNGAYDAGYDSYSLSSNDSTNMSTVQHMMKSGHLAQIPEDYSNMVQNQNALSCDVLCDEADELLIKSRQLEDAHDLVLALALCNAAATKARAAMNAPYNNPQTLTLARMKHNTCIMRARSLHRRMTQIQPQNKENSLEIRHTREGSSGSGRHSRQNSKDKGHHSRQSSRELLLQQDKEKSKPIKNIEIYATLPKRKDVLKAKINDINIDDEENLIYSKAPERESRSIFSRSKNKDTKSKEKRSRSEDRNKINRGDFSIAPDLRTAQDTLKKAKEIKEEKKDKDGKNKKQHKIRRKLLMGGLIRRKNKSLPDLTDSNAEDQCQSPRSADDTTIGLRAAPEPLNQGMTGYVSEGHLEFSGATSNPNLERSKLMRKSFHGSAGKILTAAKVPPPPPLRTTSQLSRSKSNISEVADKCQFNIYGDVNIYHNLAPFNQPQEEQSSMSLPYYGHSNSSYDDDSFSPSSHIVVTQAEVHYEHNPESTNSTANSGVDEVDCCPSQWTPLIDLPPYPSPSGSAIHSRQASEDFPPPPPPLDLSVLDEHLPQVQLKEQFSPKVEPESLLGQLQNKRMQILTHENDNRVPKQSNISPQNGVRSTGDTWLKELQAKQAVLRTKLNENISNSDGGKDEVNTQRFATGESKVKSVKDLASKFENVLDVSNGHLRPQANLPKAVNTNTQPIFKNADCHTIAPEQIAEEIREVEMITSAVNKVFGEDQRENSDDSRKLRHQKKKSVSFCDQVILVATAEDQEEETYIPNPILERVLRSAVNNPETTAIRQELMALRDRNGINQSPIVQRSPELASSKPSTPRPEMIAVNEGQSLPLRRNSVENLLQETNTRLPPQMTYNGEIPIEQRYLSLPQSYQPYQQNANLPQLTPDEQYYPYNGYGQMNQNYQYHNTQHKMQNYNGIPQQPQNEYLDRRLPEHYISPNNQSNIEQNNVQCIRQSQYAEVPYHEVQHQQMPVQFDQKVPYQEVQQQQTPVQFDQNSHMFENMSTYQGQYSHLPPHAYRATERVRQSPYQSVPHNPIQPNAYGATRQTMRNNQNINNNYGFSSSPRATPHSQPNMRYSTPSPSGYLTVSASPVPSVNSCSNSQQNPYPCHPNSPYQRIPPLNDYPQNVPSDLQQYQKQVSHPGRMDIYQRVPQPHTGEPIYPAGTNLSHYRAPSPKHMFKKTVSFQPGTKGCESPIPKAIITPIVVNNANNSIPTDKTKCSLCRKNNVVALNVYCKDCEFYMSRFKPRT